MLAITGGKGGAGKTTTALGLAVALADRRRAPIVIDADVDMPNLHIRAEAPNDGLERLAAGESIDAVAHESSAYPGVSIVGATPGTDLHRALRSVRTDRPVILDGAAGVSERAVTPLRYADTTVVVGRGTPAAVTDTVKTLRMARSLDTPISAVVLSRTPSVPDGVSAQFRVDPIYPIPTVSAPITGESVRQTYDEIVTKWANA